MKKNDWPRAIEVVFVFLGILFFLDRCSERTTQERLQNRQQDSTLVNERDEYEKLLIEARNERFEFFEKWKRCKGEWEIDPNED